MTALKTSCSAFALLVPRHLIVKGHFYFIFSFHLNLNYVKYSDNQETVE